MCDLACGCSYRVHLQAIVRAINWKEMLWKVSFIAPSGKELMKIENY